MSAGVLPTLAGRCGKCAGCVESAYGEVRCLNCGWRQNETVCLTAPGTPDRLHRCRNCQHEALAGRHYCQAHLDYFKTWKKKRDAAKRAASLASGSPCAD